MRILLAVVALLWAQTVFAESFTVRIQETAIVDIPGATAAFTTNPDIADVTVPRAGQLSVTGHSAGTTQLMVVTAYGTQAFLIKVAAAPSPAAIRRPEQGVPAARYEGRYSSDAARIQNSVDVVTYKDEGRSEFHVLHVHDLHGGPGRPRDALGSIFYRHTTPDREWTLLDSMVDVSRITVSNTQIRGLHLRQGPLELHGGYASAAMYDRFFFPTERRWVAGAGYDIDRGSIRWTPSVYGFFSEPDGTAARRGVAGALAAEYRPGDHLFVRGDVGISRSVAAAGEIRYVSRHDQFRAFLSLKPKDFPTLGLADIRGEHAELDWNRRVTDRLSLSTRGTFDRFEVAALPQTIGAAGIGLRYALTPRLAILGGADLSEVRTPATFIRTTGVPLGVTYEAPAFGLAASYRLLDHSAASRRGDSLRLSGHMGRGRFSASAWAERQRRAPTLDLIFSAEPGLELALLRLGISVRTPEDVGRALRDNAALIDLGFITGVNVDLTPRRVQAGFNLGWMGTGMSSNHLRLLAVYGRDEGISSTRENGVATLTYGRRIFAATDLYAAYSWWYTSLGMQDESGTSFDVGLRQQFSGLPRFLRQSGTIDGFAFLDPAMQGLRNSGSEPLADLEITLDATLTTRTDARGAYAFRGVAPGPHRVAARLPQSPRAYFTTPSHAETDGPARIDFGLVLAAARIDGRVVSDAGVGIAGVVVSAAALAGAPISATTGAAGSFVLAVPPGTFRLVLAEQSLPPGYTLAAAAERDVTVGSDAPQSVVFAVTAIRTIAGRASGASQVRIEALGRSVPVDRAGNFLFRSMPAGTFTLVAGARTQTVTLPPEPFMVANVELESATASRLPRRGSTAPPPSTSAAFVVQTGAFREQQNASALLRQLQRRGEPAFAIDTKTLTVVYVGPFETRSAAVVASERLRRNGFDAFATRSPADGR